MDSSIAGLEAVLEGAVANHKVQAASLLVAREGEVAVHRAYEQPASARVDRVFDLASLTKNLATASVLMLLVEEGAVALSARVDDVLPELCETPCGALNIVQLLEHSGGLPPWRPYYELVSTRAADGVSYASATGSERKALIRQLVSAELLQSPPGERTIYGDAGYMLLEWIIERLTGETLDGLFDRRIAEPLGLGHIFFIDLDRPEQRAARLARHRFAETELCAWRERRLVAEVQDDNAHAMGGVAGHAGLFATAYDIHVIARELVAAYHGARAIFSRDVVRRFFDHRSAVRDGEVRALGWQLASGADASAGERFGKDSVGHNGFSGTSLWIDLSARLWVVLLTNRVYYGRENLPMVGIRTQVHDHAHLGFA